MSIPLRITFRNIPPSEFVEARIRDKVEKLYRFSDWISGVNVSIEVPHRHHQKGGLYQVNLEILIPGEDIVVTRSSANPAHEDLYVAIRDAFGIALRQLEQRAGRQRAARTRTAPVARALA